MNQPLDHLNPSADSEKQDLNKRLERISWGLFLIMIGGIALVPQSFLPQGTWLIGVGLIMLGLNAARLYYGIHPSTFTLVLGVIALLSGIGEFLGVNLPVLPILLILIGASIILRPLIERDRFTG